MKNSRTYDPKSLADLVWPSNKIKKDVQAVIDRLLVTNLLFSGPPGTGKTTLSRLIPELIEKNLNPGDLLRINGSSESSIDVIRTKIEMHSKLMPSGVRRYTVIEEADGLTTNAQKALKMVIDDTFPACMYIFTTNHLDKVDEAIQSRCHLIQMTRPTVGLWLPRARSILHGEGMNVPDEKILELLQNTNGDGRQIVRICLQAASRYHASDNALRVGNT